MRKVILLLGMYLIGSPIHATENGKINSEIYFDKETKISPNISFAVLPFELTAPWINANTAVQKRNVELINTEKMETCLLGAGVKVIERRKIEGVLHEQALSKTGITQDSSIDTGKLLSADVIVTGVIPARGYNKYANTGRLELLIKGVDVNTGEIVFKASLDSRFDTSERDFLHDMGQLENQAYKLLENRIKEKVITTPPVKKT